MQTSCLQYKNFCFSSYFHISRGTESSISRGSAWRVVNNDKSCQSAHWFQAPVVISRDHHDVSGTDSPFRETSNIYDGSAFCADMAVQNAIGDSFRGATWIALHNGGGVGW